jgi:hypothetical protein
MKTAMRIFISFFVLVACYIFIYLLSFALIRDAGEIKIFRMIISLLIAAGVGIFVWKKAGFKSMSLESSVLFGGLIGGALGFILGFFGPLIFHIAGNQGPLAGIFITGPLGFILGLVGGGVYWKVKANQQMTKI